MFSQSFLEPIELRKNFRFLRDLRHCCKPLKFFTLYIRLKRKYHTSCP